MHWPHLPPPHRTHRPWPNYALFHQEICSSNEVRPLHSVPERRCIHPVLQKARGDVGSTRCSLSARARAGAWGWRCSSTISTVPAATTIVAGIQARCSLTLLLRLPIAVALTIRAFLALLTSRLLPCIISIRLAWGSSAVQFRPGITHMIPCLRGWQKTNGP